MHVMSSGEKKNFDRPVDYFIVRSSHPVFIFFPPNMLKQSSPVPSRILPTMKSLACNKFKSTRRRSRPVENFYNSVILLLIKNNNIYFEVYVCFFWSFGIFFSSGRGSFLVLSAPWHAGSSPGLRTQVWALDEVRGTCSGGSKSHVCSGRDSENLEPSRPVKLHVQIKRLSDVSCDISNLRCHRRRQTILTW